MRLLMAFLFVASVARAEPMKEFMMSCTYGVLAGTLVGTATLAFTDKPGENLQAIARGASLGLYAGILLGVYVVYIVPGQFSDEEEFDVNVMKPPKLNIYPTLSDSGQLDGVQGSYRIYDF